MIRALISLLLLAVAPTSAPSTRPAVTQPAVKPVPLLTPQQEMATFMLPAGFRAQLVAQEPMVEHPVFVTFDPNGRMWVAEMRSYMPDTSGWGEDKPTGARFRSGRHRRRRADGQEHGVSRQARAAARDRAGEGRRADLLPAEAAVLP